MLTVKKQTAISLKPANDSIAHFRVARPRNELQQTPVLAHDDRGADESVRLPVVASGQQQVVGLAPVIRQGVAQVAYTAAQLLYQRLHRGLHRLLGQRELPDLLHTSSSIPSSRELPWPERAGSYVVPRLEFDRLNRVRVLIAQIARLLNSSSVATLERLKVAAAAVPSAKGARASQRASTATGTFGSRVSDMEATVEERERPSRYSAS
eukprot:Polyplicarium_translucidae@DN2290_c0_g1_i3.p1